MLRWLFIRCPSAGERSRSAAQDVPAAQQQDQAPHDRRRAADVSARSVETRSGAARTIRRLARGISAADQAFCRRRTPQPGAATASAVRCESRLSGTRGITAAVSGTAAKSCAAAISGPTAAKSCSGNNYSIPAHRTIKPGTYVMVRIDRGFFPDRNQPGDTFFGTLANRSLSTE